MVAGLMVAGLMVAGLMVAGLMVAGVSGRPSAADCGQGGRGGA
jgi:hypothetical protein